MNKNGNHAYGLRENANTRNQRLIPWKNLLIIFMFLALCHSVITTQQIAKHYDYQTALGSPIAQQYYNPFSWVSWLSKFGSSNSQVGTIVTRNTGILGFLFIVIAGIVIFRRNQHGDEIEDLHGSAKFADNDDIKKLNLTENKGVFIGGYYDEKKKKTHLLRHDGKEHVLAFAPTRSGKGVCLVIPTLLGWTDSAVVYDLKGENFALTAGWREKHANNHILKFEPAVDSDSSSRFNPLEEIRLDTSYDVSDAQNIAMMIMDDNGKGLTDYWDKAGFAALTGILLHICYYERRNRRKANLAMISASLNNPDRPKHELWADMMEFHHKEGQNHPLIAQQGADLSEMAENQLSGVLGTITTKLSLYDDPIVAKNTSESDFQIMDLMNHLKPVTLYICVGATDKDRMRPLTRLLISQILRGNTRDLSFNDNGEQRQGYKHRMLMLMDEFTSLGKLEVFQESMAFLAGYGIKCYLIVQDLDQLRSESNGYGKEETIMSNAHVRIMYAPNKVTTAEEGSKMLGKTTVRVKKVSVSKKSRGMLSTPQKSTSYQEVARPLMTPSEIMKLPGIQVIDGKAQEAGDMLIFIAGNRPIYGKQFLYFQHEFFKARSAVKAPHIMLPTVRGKNRTQKLSAVVSIAEEEKNDDFSDIEAGSQHKSTQKTKNFDFGNKRKRASILKDIR